MAVSLVGIISAVTSATLRDEGVGFVRVPLGKKLFK